MTFVFVRLCLFGLTFYLISGEPPVSSSPRIDFAPDYPAGMLWWSLFLAIVVVPELAS